MPYIATRHRDPKSLQVYCETDGNSKVQSALAVDKLINSDMKKKRKRFDEKKLVESDEDHNNNVDDDVDSTMRKKRRMRKILIDWRFFYIFFVMIFINFLR